MANGINIGKHGHSLTSVSGSVGISSLLSSTVMILVSSSSESLQYAMNGMASIGSGIKSVSRKKRTLPSKSISTWWN